LEISPDAGLPDEQRNSRLPLVGTIAAGLPIEAVEEREHLDLEELFVRSSTKTGETYVLKVRGDSMIDEQIRDGDFVICEQRATYRNGQTVVALIDNGEATLKKYYKERDGRIRLQPANDNFEPIYADPQDITIQGLVIGVVRAY
jgi:repressor LexA